MSLANWTCPLEYYNDGFSCDCNCGLVDPDCLDPLKPVYNCRIDQTCNAEGICVGPPAIPISPLWTCVPGYWNVRDGCDCNCGAGARDPDCDIAGQTLYGCPANTFCNSLGLCETVTVIPTPAPTGPQVTKFPTPSPVPVWNCPAEYYNDGFSCDCNCGSPDPDCLDPLKPLYNCGLEETCSPEGVCVGGVPNIPIPDIWECDPTWWNVRDGCDCECGEGARDPDCDFEGTLWNCDEATQFCNDLGLCEDKSFSPTSAPTGPFVTKFPTPSPVAVWTCPSEYFNDGHACDCNCGIADPDCLEPSNPLYNCGLEETCSPEGVCVGGVPNIPIPDIWECDPTWWNVRDGCDCECGEGARDPDCDYEGTLWNCDEATQFCNDLGLCEDKSFSPTSAPTGPFVTKFPTSSPTVEADASTQNLFLAIAGALLSVALVLLLVALYCATKKNTTGVKEYVPETKKKFVSEEKKADVMAFGSGPTL